MFFCRILWKQGGGPRKLDNVLSIESIQKERIWPWAKREKDNPEFKSKDQEQMRLIDEQYLKTPSWGSRSMWNHLRRLGYKVNRKKVQRLMRLMALKPFIRSQDQPTAFAKQSIPYIYLWSSGDWSELRKDLSRWFGFYNVDQELF